ARSGIRESVNLAKDRGELVEFVDRGPIRILNRDGLLWLIAKRRLGPALRDAAERYRSDYQIIHGGVLRSCLDDSRSGGAGAEAMEALRRARENLEGARVKGLARDGSMTWLMDEVAGKGSTLRDLAQGNQQDAAAYEVEFRIACRLLARHYGLST